MSDLLAQIELEIPRLRRFARALVRDPQQADDRHGFDDAGWQVLTWDAEGIEEAVSSRLDGSV